MELRTATIAEMKAAYEALLLPSFPPAELKPYRVMVNMVEDGCYDPLILVDGSEILGTCFICFGVPGWALLDYLCTNPNCRNGGYGGEMIRMMREAYPGWVILGEAEAPEFAPDAAMAERRLGFYARNDARLATYDSEAFGVHYRTLYWADAPVSDEELSIQHRFIYVSRFGEEKYAKYVRIPCPAGAEPMPQVPWNE